MALNPAAESDASSPAVPCLALLRTGKCLLPPGKYMITGNFYLNHANQSCCKGFGDGSDPGVPVFGELAVYFF